MNAAAQARGDKIKAASILAALKFSSAPQPKKTQPDQRSPRDVVREFLAQQMGLVVADISGKPFTVTKTRFKKDGRGGSVKTTVEVTPRRSYWQGDDGKFYLTLRYGATVIHPTPGMTSIEAGSSLDGVRNTLELIQKAVDAGELDSAAEAARTNARRSFAGKKH
jgi:hypothetical protein